MDMEMVSVYEGIILLAALIGVYLKVNNEVCKLRNRVYTLEESRSEVTEPMMAELRKLYGENKLTNEEEEVQRNQSR